MYVTAMTSPRYTLKMFMPKDGKIRIPTQMVTMNAFNVCPACGGGRDSINKTSIRFTCGMTQVLTEDDEFAVISTCPFAMVAVEELRARKLSRPMSIPQTLVIMGTPDEFKVGDKVRWVSQSAGNETMKRGIVVAQVPPQAKPDDYIPDGMRRNSSSGYGKPRDHVTYLIKVHGKGGMVYWPRVHVLQREG